MPDDPAVAVRWFEKDNRLSRLFSHHACARHAPDTAHHRNRRRALRSALFDLTEFEIDRHSAPEDRNFHLEARALLVHFLDETVERRERTIGNTNRFADLESDRRLGTLDALLDLIQNTLGFSLGDRHRL